MISVNLFSFVSDSRYRKLLENDYIEISKCIESECYKSATTLAGSIVEALLTDYLLDKSITIIPNATSCGNISVDKAGLYNIIEYCKNNRLISTRVYYLLQAIRDFRNLIHPTKAIRIELEVNKDDAILYKSTLDIVLQEIGKSRQNELGSTAEQLLYFMLNDEHGAELFSHMVQKVKSEEEIQKYLLNIIPKQLNDDLQEKWKYFDDDGPNFDSPQEADFVSMISRRILSLYESFHICFNYAKPETKRVVANRMIEIFRNGTSIEKNIFSELFEEDYINLIDPIDKVFLVDYFFVNSKTLSEKQFAKILNTFAPELGKDKRGKLFDTSIFLLKVREKKGLNPSIAKYLLDIKSIDNNEYKEYVSKLSALIVTDNFESEIIEFNDLIADLLTRINETVPEYMPF